MTHTIHKPRPLYDAISTRIATGTGKPCGDAVRPPGASPPYSVIHPLPDIETYGTLTDPTQISHQLFQVTCVGKTMDEAQELQSDVRAALLGFAPTVAGRSPNRIELDLGSGVRRDDDGPVFYTTDRYNLYVD